MANIISIGNIAKSCLAINYCIATLAQEIRLFRKSVKTNPTDRNALKCIVHLKAAVRHCNHLLSQRSCSRDLTDEGFGKPLAPRLYIDELRYTNERNN